MKSFLAIMTVLCLIGCGKAPKVTLSEVYKDTPKVNVGSVTVEIDPAILKSFEFSDFRMDTVEMEMTVLWKDSAYLPSKLWCVSYNENGVKLQTGRLEFVAAAVNIGEPTRAFIPVNDGDTTLIKIVTYSP
jgi:hypothetical protein